LAETHLGLLNCPLPAQLLTDAILSAALFCDYRMELPISRDIAQFRGHPLPCARDDHGAMKKAAESASQEAKVWAFAKAGARASLFSRISGRQGRALDVFTPPIIYPDI
jgi:hypothetical protein